MLRATWTAPSTSIAGSSPTTQYRTVLRDLKNLFDPTAGIVLQEALQWNAGLLGQVRDLFPNTDLSTTTASSTSTAGTCHGSGLNTSTTLKGGPAVAELSPQ